MAETVNRWKQILNLAAGVAVLILTCLELYLIFKLLPLILVAVALMVAIKYLLPMVPGWMLKHMPAEAEA